MKFMVMVHASKESEAGVMPNEQELAEMGRFNEQLMKAGILLDGGGLRPSKDAVRIKYQAKKPTIVDGPFPETKELIAGYWILEARSKEEIVEWMRKAPFIDGEIDIRPFFVTEDFVAGPAADASRELWKKVEAQKSK